MKQAFSLHPDFKNFLILEDSPLSLLLHINEKQIPWIIQIPKIPNAKELSDLEDEVFLQIMREMKLLQDFLLETYKPDKLNFAALGNLTPQLHLHHLVRYSTDICWPRPVWGNIESQAWSEEEFSKLHQNLKEKWQNFRKKS